MGTVHHGTSLSRLVEKSLLLLYALRRNYNCVVYSRFLYVCVYSGIYREQNKTGVMSDISKSQVNTQDDARDMTDWHQSQLACNLRVHEQCVVQQPSPLSRLSLHVHHLYNHKEKTKQNKDDWRCVCLYIHLPSSSSSSSRDSSLSSIIKQTHTHERGTFVKTVHIQKYGKVIFFLVDCERCI